PVDITKNELIPNADLTERIPDLAKIPQHVGEPWSMRIPVLGRTVSYGTLRLAAVLSGLLGVSTLAAVGITVLVAARRGEAALIRARYGSMLVAGEQVQPHDLGRAINLSKFDDLLRIAR